MSDFPLFLNLDLSKARLLFLDTDLFLALPLFDHLDLLLFGFFSLPLVFLDNPRLLLLDFSILAMLFGDPLLILTLDHFLVVNPPESFFLNSLLLDGLSLNFLPLLFLLANGLFSISLLYVCDAADANSFFFHLSHTLFVLLALSDDSLLVDLPSLPLFFDLAAVLFISFTAVFRLGLIVVVLNVLPPGFPPSELFIGPVPFVVRLLIIVTLLFILVLLALSCGVDNRLAVFVGGFLLFLVLGIIIIICTIAASVRVLHITTDDWIISFLDLTGTICGLHGAVRTNASRSLFGFSIGLSKLKVVRDGLFFESSALLSKAVGMGYTSGGKDSGHKAIEFHPESG